MHNDVMIKYVKRWQELVRKQRDIDYERSVFAKDLRGEFGTDARFVKWCQEELRLTKVQAEELLLRADLAKTVGTEETWKKVGGFGALRAVEALPIAKRRHVIEVAKTTGKSIRTLVRESDKRSPAPAEPLRRSSPQDDASRLAQFILEHVPDAKITATIRAVMSRYIASSRAAKAA
jgi:hypothetical protein